MILVTDDRLLGYSENKVHHVSKVDRPFMAGRLDLLDKKDLYFKGNVDSTPKRAEQNLVTKAHDVQGATATMDTHVKRISPNQYLAYGIPISFTNHD